MPAIDRRRYNARSISGHARGNTKYRFFLVPIFLSAIFLSAPPDGKMADRKMGDRKMKIGVLLRAYAASAKSNNIKNP
ncbi:MAG TPA: hypothetical protein VJ810_35075 [Blastocatellia bacterium]|nr:hypothetical protein [Blastocatellia bacterium]